ncbi:MAG: cytochrome c [Alphaproteobacteria bacterium]|nr:cytochrome c [Alphaproteobacteria bacterium]MBU0798416.1 cytochrome c [Alphaproteobacteria bacterium]MBU0889095.1 cytochrome c [Alphaproteobacteria bacterium]MBU1813278.1 cytochrome c [Alphaproteobacteria bacterium]MBU2091763.1 cytochrome c [Alphaproteobacteria bacterium]
MLRRRFLLVFALMLTAAPVLAQNAAQPGSIAAGQVIAEERCARCHAIAATGNSPFPAAPPFRELQKKYPIEQLAEALAEGIGVGHPDMPEFVLQPVEIEGFLAFLNSLQPSR